MKLEHLLCPKVGGGHKPTCAPPPLLKVGRHVPPPAPPSPTPLVSINITYLMGYIILCFTHCLVKKRSDISPTDTVSDGAHGINKYCYTEDLIL